MGHLLELNAPEEFDPKRATRKPHLGSGGLFNNDPKSPGRDPAVLADRPFGEWNKFHIIQVGERTTVYLNDKLVVDHARMENYWNRNLPLPHGTRMLEDTEVVSVKGIVDGVGHKI